MDFAQNSQIKMPMQFTLANNAVTSQPQLQSQVVQN